MLARQGICCLISAYLIGLTLALPTSIVEAIKSSEMKNSKVKRARPDQENIGRVNYYNKPTSAIKRGASLPLNQDQEDALLANADLNMDNVQSALFYSPNLPFDDKTIAEYEKGFRYGANKDKLDEALENAVLKGEMYGADPYSQYRFYGDERRRRRDTTSKKLRLKRSLDLTPEEVLALLALYENNHQALRESDNYRQPIVRYSKNFDIDDADGDTNDETWLNGPVYPHAATLDSDGSDNFVFDYPNVPPPDYKSPRWGGFEEAKKKRLF